MEVTETLSEGLKRTLKVVVDKSELERDLSTRLNELSGRVNLKGFRPGKVPAAHLRRVYGKSVMAEVLQKKVDDSTKQVLTERQLKPAYQPEVVLPDDQAEMDRVMDGKGDLAFTLNFEVVPPIEVKDFAAIEIEKLVADVSEDDVAGALNRLAGQHKAFEPRPAGSKAEKGDRVVVSFTGTIDGKGFEGGTAENVPLELGSGQFLPGFEDQLLGAQAGDERLVKAQFPPDYVVAKLAGKAAEFDVKVTSVDSPKPVELNDEFAKKLGLADLATLRASATARIAAELEQMSAMKLKRDLLDRLDAQYVFELPQRLVDAEFEQIWGALAREMKREGKSFADEGTSEEAARREYRAIADRRVRLGLLLGTIGDQEKITITDEEMQRALVERARQFPGQEKKVIDYYRKNTGALIELRGPLFEQKVVDRIVSKVRLTEKKVTRQELANAIQALEDEMPHEQSDDHELHHEHDHHGHDHSHDHDHEHDRDGGGETPTPEKEPTTE